MSERKFTSFGAFREFGEGRAVTEDAVREYVVGRAAIDREFRKAVVADPLTVVEAEIGIKMPGGLKLAVHEESADQLHLVLPAPVELSAKQIEQVSGGRAGGAQFANDDAFYDADGGQDYD